MFEALCRKIVICPVGGRHGVHLNGMSITNGQGYELDAMVDD